MYAVVRTGGKQYAVKEGETLKVEKLDLEPGASFDLEVLLVADEDGKDVKLGAPAVKGAKVSAKVLEQGRGKKIEVVKYKPKSRYRRKNTHRQLYTKIQVEKISA